MKQLILKLIRAYQKSWLVRHQLLKHLYMTDASCRFTPTCSEYSYQAINKYGMIKGILLSFQRIIRCHPWNKGGYDPLK